MRRGFLLVAAVLLLAISIQRTYEEVIGLVAPARALRFAGIGTILAVGTGVAGLALLRESVRRTLHPALAARTLAAFGWGWVAGVVFDLAITFSRTRTATGAATPSDVDDLISWLLASLVLATPGVVALIVSRRLPR
jgi:hypothetical protein